MSLVSDRPEAEQPVAVGASKRIVVGVDGSASSVNALGWAAAQAQRAGAALEIVAAFGPGYQYLSRTEADQCMLDDMHDARARAEELAPGIAVTGTTYEGPPELALIRESAGGPSCSRLSRPRWVQGPSPRIREPQVRSAGSMSGRRRLG